MEITLFEIVPIWSKTAATINHTSSCRKLHIVKVRLLKVLVSATDSGSDCNCVWQHFGKSPLRDGSFLVDQKQPRWRSRQTHQTPFTETDILHLKTHFIQTRQKTKNKTHQSRSSLSFHNHQQSKLLIQCIRNKNIRRGARGESWSVFASDAVNEGFISG